MMVIPIPTFLSFVRLTIGVSGTEISKDLFWDSPRVIPRISRKPHGGIASRHFRVRPARLHICRNCPDNPLYPDISPKGILETRCKRLFGSFSQYRALKTICFELMINTPQKVPVFVDRLFIGLMDKHGLTGHLPTVQNLKDRLNFIREWVRRCEGWLDGYDATTCTLLATSCLEIAMNHIATKVETRILTREQISLPDEYSIALQMSSILDDLSRDQAEDVASGPSAPLDAETLQMESTSAENQFDDKSTHDKVSSFPASLSIASSEMEIDSSPEEVEIIPRLSDNDREVHDRHFWEGLDSKVRGVHHLLDILNLKDTPFEDDETSDDMGSPSESEANIRGTEDESESEVVDSNEGNNGNIDRKGKGKEMNETNENYSGHQNHNKRKREDRAKKDKDDEPSRKKPRNSDNSRHNTTNDIACPYAKGDPDNHVECWLYHSPSMHTIK